MENLKFYGNSNTGSTQRVLLTIRYLGANVAHENITPDSPQKPGLLNNSPTGTLPLLQVGSSWLSESHAICVYLNDASNGKLLGSNALERAQVLQWSDFMTCELQPNHALTVYSLVGYYEYNQQTFNTALARVKGHFKTLDAYLAGNRQWLVGNAISLADIELFVSLRPYFTLVLTEQDRKDFANLTRWLSQVANEPNVLEICGVTRFGRVCQKGPRKIEQPKPQPQPKQEKPAETKPKETAGDNEEEGPKSKKKHPLDELPPSNFVLDVFKKDFLNTTDKRGALDRFWSSYDPAGYSIWHVHYQKLASEGKILFKTCNYASMFLQKMDNFRKYTFSCHGVYGEEPNLEIRGLWMWRGTDIAPQMKEHDAFEYHTFKRLDHNSEADRKLVEDYWLHINQGETCDGMLVQEVTCFR